MDIVFRGKWLTPNYQTNKMRNVWQTEEFIWKSCEWKDQLISTQSLLYIINAYWQNLKTSVLPDAVLVNFNWMCRASKERRKEKLKGQLEKGRLPLLMSRTSLCLFPNTRCHFVRKKTKNNSIFENLEDSILAGLGFAGFDVHGPSHCYMSSRKPFYDLRPVGNK